jgi:hypothetical protein
MKLHRHLTLALLVTFSLFFSASVFAADTHEVIADDAMKQMERMSTSLLAITDKASAEKAITECKDVAAQLLKIAERAKAIGKPSAEVKAQMEAKVKTRQEEFQKKMEGFGPILEKAGPDAAQVVMKGMQEIAPALEQMAKVFGEADKK